MARELEVRSVACRRERTSTLRVYHDAVPGRSVRTGAIRRIHCRRPPFRGAPRKWPGIQRSLDPVIIPLNIGRRGATSHEVACPSRQDEWTERERPTTRARARPPKAAPITLARDTTVRQGFGSIMQSSIDCLAKSETAALHGGGIECIHQMRVALRRLNATLSLFKDVIASPRTPRITDDLRWIESILGGARDWDVFATQTLQKADRDPGMGLAAENIAHAASALRRAAHRKAAYAVRSPRYSACSRALNTWVADQQWCERLDPGIRPLLEAPLAEIGRPWLRRSARKAHEAGKRIKHLTAKQRHRLRIALKQLRYDTEALSSLYAARKVNRYGGALRDLQDVLGDLNDLVVARKLLAVVKSPDCPAVDDRLRAVSAKRLKALAPAWRAFRKIPPFWE